jgi:hypothetical protein
MQRMLYRWEDRLFYRAAVRSHSNSGRWWLYCSRVAGELGDGLGPALPYRFNSHLVPARQCPPCSLTKLFWIAFSSLRSFE